MEKSGLGDETYLPPGRALDVVRYHQAVCNRPQLLENGKAGNSKFDCAWGLHLIVTAGVRVWPPDINMRSAREEAEMVIFASVREALAKCRLRPSQVCCCAAHDNLICWGARASLYRMYHSQEQTSLWVHRLLCRSTSWW
jgi:hypothetical protein